MPGAPRSLHLADPTNRIRLAVGAGLLALLAAGAAGAATPCPPTAVVVGAAEIVTPIAAVLRSRGVGAGPSECGRVVRASLAPRPNLHSYSLHIEDGYGRVSDREVSDAGTAASLIESWAIDEDADVLAPRAAPAVIEAVTAAPPAPAAGPAPVTWQVAALGEIATATDGSTWYGGSAVACGRVGPFCLGARARIARDAGNAGYDFDGGGMGGIGGGTYDADVSRTRFGGAAVVALPLSRGAFTLAPMLGLGLLWTRTSINPGPIAFSAGDLSAGAEAGVGLAGALGAHWSLVADVGGLLAVPVSTAADDGSPWAFMPPPPRGTLGFGIGLRYAR